MGSHVNITAKIFPRQGNYLHKPVKVIFHYDDAIPCHGEVIRDDMESPFLTIIRLNDGRVILSSECQFSPATHEERT